jgi:hypothetical protein
MCSETDLLFRCNMFLWVLYSKLNFIMSKYPSVLADEYRTELVRTALMKILFLRLEHY